MSPSLNSWVTTHFEEADHKMLRLIKKCCSELIDVFCQVSNTLAIFSTEIVYEQYVMYVKSGTNIGLLTYAYMSTKMTAMSETF